MSPSTKRKQISRVLLVVVVVAIIGVAIRERRDIKERLVCAEYQTRPGEACLPRNFGQGLNIQQAVLKRWEYDDTAVVETRTPLYFIHNSNWLRRQVAKHLRVAGVDPGQSYAGLRFVELGFGPSLSMGVMIGMAGASHYYGLEVADYGYVHDSLPYEVLLGLTIADPFFYQRPVESVIARITRETIEFKPDRLTLNTACPAEILGLADKGCPVDPGVHVVFSLSVLEHMPDLPLAIERMKSVLLPGGIAVHNAVFMDHDTIMRPSTNKPIPIYDHLKVSANDWKRESDCGGQHCKHKLANQLRPVDVKRLFEKAGFEVVYYVTEADTQYESARLKRGEAANGGWLPLSDEDWNQIAPHVKEGHTRAEVAEFLVWIVARKPPTPQPPAP